MTLTVRETVDAFTQAARKSPAEGALNLVGTIIELQQEHGSDLNEAWGSAMQYIAHVYGKPAHVVTQLNGLPQNETNAIKLAAETLKIQPGI